MSSFVLTVILATVILSIGLLAMAIGWWCRRRPIERGTCGMDPTKKKREGDCESQKDCSICGGGSIERKKDNDKDGEAS